MLIGAMGGAYAEHPRAFRKLEKGPLGVLRRSALQNPLETRSLRFAVSSTSHRCLGLQPVSSRLQAGVQRRPTAVLQQQRVTSDQVSPTNSGHQCIQHVLSFSRCRCCLHDGGDCCYRLPLSCLYRCWCHRCCCRCCCCHNCICCLWSQPFLLNCKLSLPLKRH